MLSKYITYGALTIRNDEWYLMNGFVEPTITSVPRRTFHISIGYGT